MQKLFTNDGQRVRVVDKQELISKVSDELLEILKYWQPVKVVLKKNNEIIKWGKRK